MKVTCAWCGCDMGTKIPLDDPATTHSICYKCMKKELVGIESEDAKLTEGQ